MSGSSLHRHYRVSNSRFALAMLLGGASLISSAVSAQVAPAPAAAQPGTTGAVAAQTGLQDIVVTAQRREQSLSKVPVSVQAVTAQTLQTRVVTDTVSLVAASPSVSFAASYAASGSGFVIRGISSAAAEGGLQQSTAMVVDGVPLARPAEFVSELGDLERVEVLRGPQGTLFGKNATAGVISIVTTRPSSRAGGYVEAQGTTDSGYTFRGMVNLPINDFIRTRFTAYDDHLDPLLKNQGFGNDILGYNNYGVNGKIDIDLADDVQLKLSGDYRHNFSTFGGSIDVIPSTGIGAQQIAVLGFVPQPGLIRANNSGYTYDRSSGYSGSAELAWGISDKLKFTSISAYRFFKSDSNIDVDNLNVGVQQGVGFYPNPTHYPVQYVDSTGPRLPENVRYFSEEARLNYSSDRLSVVGGFFYQTLTDRGPGPGSSPFVFDGAYILKNPALAGQLYYSATQVKYRINDDTWAAFADGTYKITDSISLFGGLRFTHETILDNYASNAYFTQITDSTGTLLRNADGSLIFDPVTIAINAPSKSTAFTLGHVTNNLSGRAGIQWQPTRHANFYFSYNRGYKGSAVDVSRAATLPNPATGYSPVLAPELASSFELGTKLQLFSNKVQLNVNLFSEKIKNLQQSITLPSTATQLINAGGVKTKGVEIESRVLVASGLTLEGDLAYIDPKYSGNVFVGCYPTQTAAQGCVGGRTSIDGVQTLKSQKLRYTLGATYQNDLPGMPFGITAHVGFNYFSKTRYQVAPDPLAVQPGYGLLDASLSLDGRSNRWQLQFFGKNLTNKLHYAYLSNVDNTISRISGFLPRDYKRYGGVRLKYNF